MLRAMLMVSGAITACTPSPKEVTMQTRDAAFQSNVQRENPEARSENPSNQDASNPSVAAQAPALEPVSAAENPAPIVPVDTPLSAKGRRVLSTAFVRLGPDGRLNVTLHDGQVLVLKNVVMRPTDYCGVWIRAGQPHVPFCGKYADVAVALPVDGMRPASDLSAAANPS